MIELLGVTIHEPAVVFTDLGLAVLGAWLGARLWQVEARGTLQAEGAVLLAGLASAAFWGAIFHAFFPSQTATTAGFLAWMPVALSVIVVGGTLLDLGIRVLRPEAARSRQAIVGAYAVAFTGVVLFVDESFTTIVRFYGPVLALFLLLSAGHAVRTSERGWRLIATGVAGSVGAAVLQQAGVALHPVYFDHNAVYHVVQGAAVVLLYLGFRRATLPTARFDRASGADPAPGRQ